MTSLAEESPHIYHQSETSHLWGDVTEYPSRILSTARAMEPVSTELFAAAGPGRLTPALVGVSGVLAGVKRCIGSGP